MSFLEALECSRGETELLWNATETTGRNSRDTAAAAKDNSSDASLYLELGDLEANVASYTNRKPLACWLAETLRCVNFSGIPKSYKIGPFRIRCGQEENPSDLWPSVLPPQGVSIRVRGVAWTEHGKSPEPELPVIDRSCGSVAMAT